LLQESHFGSDQSELPSADPIAPVQMVLQIDQIKHYDRNPRKEPNPAYPQIFESIRAQRGLTSNLSVTRRPGDERYMLHAGGNTRLKILKSLWQETRDEVFFRVNCWFSPWVSESDILSAHLIENELRGDLVLIDKAFAVRDLKIQFENEAGEPLSRNGFLKQLDRIGFKLSKRQLIRYEYATESLDALIPETLRANLGGRVIDRLRTLENNYREFCENNVNLGT